MLPVTASANVVTCGDRSVVIEVPHGYRRETILRCHQKEVQTQAELIRGTFNDSKIIISIDRLDYSKGILQRLQAFELLLQQNPEYKGKITLYMIVVPSRDTVPQYAHLRDEIDKRVGNINSVYRTIEWSPINYYYRSVPIEMLSALYSIADICRATPMRDGMNLVSYKR